MPISPNLLGQPGFATGNSVVFPSPFLDGICRYKPEGGQIDGFRARDVGFGNPLFLRPGLLMAKSVANRTYANWVLGTSTVALTTSATTLQVSPTDAVEMARRLGSQTTFTLTGPPAASGTAVQQTVTFSAINTATGAITITATGVAFVAGSVISEVGYDVPVTLMKDQMTPMNGTPVDWGHIPQMGIIDVNNLIGYPTDTGLQAWVKGKMSTTAGPKFIFNDENY